MKTHHESRKNRAAAHGALRALTDDQLGAAAGGASVSRVIKTAVNAVEFGVELLGAAIGKVAYDAAYGPGAPV